MTREEIGQVLREWRERCGMSRQQVADRIGKTTQTIGHWETGHAQPDADTLFMLCDMYGASVDSAFSLNKKVELTSREYDTITNYRKLDDFGKRAVDAVLAVEVERCAGKK